MLRKRINEALTTAIKAKDRRRVSTLRLTLASIKDREIAARGDDNAKNIDDKEILNILQTMIKQRRESISHYEQGGRLELAEQELEEIAIIQEFLPQQIGGAELEAAARTVIAELQATGLKDMGRTMSALKDRYAGQMDFSQAAAVVKSILAG